MLVDSLTPSSQAHPSMQNFNNHPKRVWAVGLLIKCEHQSPWDLDKMSIREGWQTSCYLHVTEERFRMRRIDISRDRKGRPFWNSQGECWNKCKVLDTRQTHSAGGKPGWTEFQPLSSRPQEEKQKAHPKGQPDPDGKKKQKQTSNWQSCPWEKPTTITSFKFLTGFGVAVVPVTDRSPAMRRNFILSLCVT